MRLILSACLAFFLLVSAAYAQNAPREKIFNAETFTLDNGMDVVVIPNHRVPVVTHMVWYGVGAADEDPGQSGLAHFVEHLMFKGTEKVPPGEFSKRVRALGGNDNAFTGQDFTAYFQSIAVEHLETVMTMEADRMTNLMFDQEHVDSERLVVLEERRQRTENDPKGYFFEQMRTTLYPNHPYSDPVIGWLHEMEALTRENVSAFYNKWYAPNNATLIVSGDMTAEKLKPLAEKVYGVIPAREVPERSWTEVPPLLAKPRLVLRHPTIRQPSVHRLYRAPSSAQNKGDSLALQVLGNIMGSGATSRFYKALVVEQKIATHARFHYTPAGRLSSTIQVSATPTDGVELEALEQAMDAELLELLTDGVTETEVAESKARLKDMAVFSRDSIAGPAMNIGQTLLDGNTLDDIEYWPYDIESVTIEQINEVAKKYLSEESNKDRLHVTGYILPTQQDEVSE